MSSIIGAVRPTHQTGLFERLAQVRHGTVRPTNETQAPYRGLVLQKGHINYGQGRESQGDVPPFSNGHDLAHHLAARSSSIGGTSLAGERFQYADEQAADALDDFLEAVGEFRWTRENESLVADRPDTPHPTRLPLAQEHQAKLRSQLCEEMIADGSYLAVPHDFVDGHPLSPKSLLARTFRESLRSMLWDQHNIGALPTREEAHQMVLEFVETGRLGAKLSAWCGSLEDHYGKKYDLDLLLKAGVGLTAHYRYVLQNLADIQLHGFSLFWIAPEAEKRPSDAAFELYTMAKMSRSAASAMAQYEWAKASYFVRAPRNPISRGMAGILEWRKRKLEHAHPGLGTMTPVPPKFTARRPLAALAHYEHTAVCRALTPLILNYFGVSHLRTPTTIEPGAPLLAYMNRGTHNLFPRT